MLPNRTSLPPCEVQGEMQDVQHAHSRQAQISVQVKQLPDQSSPGKFSRGGGRGEPG